MSVRNQTADDPPKRTPSFVCEVRGRVTPAQERTLLARLETARQVGATCLGQARRRVWLVRESRAFQHARTLPRDDPARKALFRKARAQHDFSEYALHAYRVLAHEDDAHEECNSTRSSLVPGKPPP